MEDIQRPPAQPGTHPLALVSLIIGILGLTGVLPLVGSIGALIAGKLAQSEIRQKPMAYTGENIARTGIILGWIGVGIFGLLCLLAVLAFLFFIPVQSIETFPFQP